MKFAVFCYLLEKNEKQKEAELKTTIWQSFGCTDYATMDGCIVKNFFAIILV